MEHPKLENPELRAQALENLKTYSQGMAELDITWFIMEGTLLGAIREGDFIKNDVDDIDIGIFEEDAHRIPEIITKMESLGFRKRKHFVLDGLNKGCSLGRGGNHIDNLVFHRRKTKAYNLGRNWVQLGKLSYIAYVYPVHHFQKLEKFNFKGVEVNIPSDTKALLELRYHNWMVPVYRGEGFSWRNTDQNPVITGDFDYKLDH